MFLEWTYHRVFSKTAGRRCIEWPWRTAGRWLGVQNDLAYVYLSLLSPFFRYGLRFPCDYEAPAYSVVQKVSLWHFTVLQVVCLFVCLFSLALHLNENDISNHRELILWLTDTRSRAEERIIVFCFVESKGLHGESLVGPLRPFIKYRRFQWVGTTRELVQPFWVRDVNCNWVFIVILTLFSLKSKHCEYFGGSLHTQLLSLLLFFLSKCLLLWSLCRYDYELCFSIVHILQYI